MWSQKSTWELKFPTLALTTRLVQSFTIIFILVPPILVVAVFCVLPIAVPVGYLSSSSSSNPALLGVVGAAAETARPRSDQRVLLVELILRRLRPAAAADEALDEAEGAAAVLLRLLLLLLDVRQGLFRLKKWELDHSKSRQYSQVTV